MAGQYDEHHFNVSGIDDFEKEGRNTGKLLLNIVGGVFFLIVAMAIYKKL